jgi:hypothetical protein
MNRNGVVVYSLKELKDLYPSTGTKGMWAFHANCHAGHIWCAEEAQRCDWVVGVLYNNMADGEKWMTGYTSLKTYPITKSDIDILKKYSDVCLILTGDYHPYKQYWSQIKNEFDEQFPISCLKEKGIIEDQDAFNVLLYSVSIRFLLHGVYKMHFDYQAQGGKDRFRSIGYVDYVFDRWGVKIDLLDSIRDENGNSISKTISGLPKNLKERINKPLLLSEFETIEQVQEHINTIEGLIVLNFYRMNGWVHATFQFEGYKSWVEGVRCK